MSKLDGGACCKYCKDFNQKTFNHTDGDTGKCFKLMKETVTHVNSYAIVKSDFYCGFFYSDRIYTNPCVQTGANP